MSRRQQNDVQRQVSLALFFVSSEKMQTNKSLPPKVERKSHLDSFVLMHVSCPLCRRLYRFVSLEATKTGTDNADNLTLVYEPPMRQDAFNYGPSSKILNYYLMSRFHAVSMSFESFRSQLSFNGRHNEWEKYSQKRDGENFSTPCVERQRKKHNQPMGNTTLVLSLFWIDK